MEHRLLTIRFALLCLLTFVLAGLWFVEEGVISGSEAHLMVRFLDVGQGDAIHIMTPDGYEALIDGGASAAVLRELVSGRSFFDRHIDLVVATHPDADHIGGLVDVLERFEVATVLETSNQNDTPVADRFMAAVAAEGAKRIDATAGQVISLGASTTVRVLAPMGDETNWPSNAASIVIQLVYGETSFLLTGDVPSATERYLVEQAGQSLASTVLKLGHHGSDTSSDPLFLDQVAPQFAVVSAAAESPYGHPHPAVVARVRERGIPLVSTAEAGTLVFQSDGRRVWLGE